jgi:hypothetical protein
MVDEDALWDELMAAEAEVERLRKALDRIEAEPENTFDVQAIARAALSREEA